MSVRTTYLGQFTQEHANAIAQRLEEAGIEWWQKQSGTIASMLFRSEWGVRLFVDRSKIDEARMIAQEVVGGGS